MEVHFVDAKARKHTRQLPCVVGRGDDVGFRINSDSVSRRHCTFTLDDGVVRVTDLGSTNGTFLEKEKLAANVAMPVSSGAQVRIGGAVFRVEYKPATKQSPPVRGDDTVPLAAADLPELEAVTETACETIPELEPVAEEVPELEPVEPSPKSTAPVSKASGANKPAAKAPVPKASAPKTPASKAEPTLAEIEPAAPAAGAPAFPDAVAPPAAAPTDFSALTGTEPAAPAADASFDFLAADAAPPPAADDKLDDFFKSLS